MSDALREIGFVGGRSLRRSLRQPAFVMPSIVFPLVLLAINSSGLAAATRIPGFPTDTYLDFALTVTFIQGALFAAISAGTSIAIDIETGFLSRLSLTPLRGGAMLVGQLGGAMCIALIGAVTYLTVGVIAGSNMDAGVGGALVLLALALVIAAAFAGIGTAIGVRSGQAQVVQGVFPLMFVTLFLSSSNMPRDLIAIGWFREVATYNPVSYLVEGMRSLIITGWDGEALAQGFGWAVVVGVVSWSVAVVSLRTRMART